MKLWKSALTLAFGVLMAFSASNSSAGLLGHYYNLSSEHPDFQQGAPFGVETGLVKSDLGADGNPDLLDATRSITQLDWYDGTPAFSRVDNSLDFTPSSTPDGGGFYPLSNSLVGDPYHFGVHWEGYFEVSTSGNYSFSMGSDDDSWLFINDELKLDNGGVHAFNTVSDTFTLGAGVYTIDIFFAERNTVASGFKFVTNADLQPVPEPATMLLFGSGLVGLVGFARRKKK